MIESFRAWAEGLGGYDYRPKHPENIPHLFDLTETMIGELEVIQDAVGHFPSTIAKRYRDEIYGHIRRLCENNPTLPEYPQQSNDPKNDLANICQWCQEYMCIKQPMKSTVASKYFHISADALRKAAYSGKIKSYRDNSGSIYVDIVEIAQKHQKK